MDVIYATRSGSNVGLLDYYEIDFDIGEDAGANTWQARISPEMLHKLPDTARIFIPGTEYGGFCKRHGVDYRTGDPTIGGYTWRGMLQKRADNFSSMTSLDLADAMRTIIGDRWNYYIEARLETVGTRSRWGGARHVDILEAAQKAVAGTGYRLDIRTHEEMYSSAIVSVRPIKIWTEGLYDNFHTKYSYEIEKDFVNKLTCLGEGELDNRLVRYIYADENGNISPTQVITGPDVIEAVFDYAGADADTLLYYGERRMRELLKTAKRFTITVDTERVDIELGDVVRVYDESTGQTMQAPITAKTLHIAGDVPRIEYQLSNDILIQEATP